MAFALAAVGDDGVRFYAAAPLLPDFSHLARAQATFWADKRRGRLMVARRMYALRLGEVLLIVTSRCYAASKGRG
jgi:CRISP-associated protein Cas1